MLSRHNSSVAEAEQWHEFLRNFCTLVAPPLVEFDPTAAESIRRASRQSPIVSGARKRESPNKCGHVHACPCIQARRLASALEEHSLEGGIGRVRDHRMTRAHDEEGFASIRPPFVGFVMFPELADELQGSRQGPGLVGDRVCRDRDQRSDSQVGL
jgi:hypothetical protein